MLLKEKLYAIPIFPCISLLITIPCNISLISAIPPNSKNGMTNTKIPILINNPVSLRRLLDTVKTPNNAGYIFIPAAIAKAR